MLAPLLFGLAIINSGGNRDFYSILSLRHDATEREIERAFQKLSRKYHPDKNKGDKKAAERFSDINDAYGTLKDPQKRRIYDLYGEGGASVYETPTNDLDEVLGLGGNNPNDNTAKIIRMKGKNYLIKFPVDLRDFMNPNNIHYLYPGKQCAVVHKRVIHAQMSWLIQQFLENTTLSLFVEKGADEGTVILFKNAGDTTELNAPSDIEVEIVSKPHPLFERKGSDLHMNLRLTLKEALIGFRKTFKNLDGSDLVVESDKPLGCDQTIVLKGKGLPLYLYPGEFGDIVIHPLLKWPKQLTDEQREKLANALMTKTD